MALAPGSFGVRVGLACCSIILQHAACYCSPISHGSLLPRPFPTTSPIFWSQLLHVAQAYLGLEASSSLQALVVDWRLTALTGTVYRLTNAHTLLGGL